MRPMDTIFDGEAPRHVLDLGFTVGISELDEDGRVRPSSVCNWLQEAATIQAARLGMGMPLITGSTHSWMLARMTLEFHRWPKWNERVVAHTWPCGMKGRLLALRDFLVHDSEGGLLAAATSEWLYIDISSGKVARLPPELADFAPPGTLRAPVADLPAPDPKAALGEGVRHSTIIPVRHADADLNRHANHLRLIDWLFEPIPAAPRPARLDVVFRQGAMPGETVASEVVEDAASGIRHHRLSRRSDDTTLAVATTLPGGR